MKKQLIVVLVIIAVVVAVVFTLKGRNSSELQANISGPATPVGANFPKEQREAFARKLEEGFRAKGVPATIMATGDNSTTMVMEIPKADKEKARLAAGDTAAINDLRTMGFKRFTISNGKESWDVDLKN